MNKPLTSQQVRQLTARPRKHLIPFQDSIKYISKDQIKRLLNSIDNVRNKALIKMLYSSGCRVGELTLAMVDDIDFNEGIWSIPAINTKSKRARQPRIHESTMNDIKAYLKAYDLTRGRIFPITIRQVQNIVRKYGDKVEIERLHPHTLRHTHIVHSLMDSVPMSAVQKQVGHVNLKTTQIYSNLSVADVKEAYKDVDF